MSDKRPESTPDRTLRLLAWATVIYGIAILVYALPNVDVTIIWGGQ